MCSFNVDLSVKYVKTIADKCRCVICDRLDGQRVRYPCGHTVCDNCVITAEDCLLCLSPPKVSTHVSDGPLNLRVKHASNLLDSFQELFMLDVYRRQRVSDQLRLEKQLFPECIQALSKYSNRRHSNISIENKENLKRTLFPGENISKTNIFEINNKMSYVRQWLNENDNSLKESSNNLPRKPFTDINVNGQNLVRLKRQNKVTKKKKDLSRSKIDLKPINSEYNSKSRLSITRKRKDVEMKDCTVICKKIKCDNNESGIVIEDEVTIINETQPLDKDKKAWLAVIEADKNSSCDDPIFSEITESENKVLNKNPTDKPSQCLNVDTVCKKVPFYKKSSLFKYNTYQCNENKNKFSKTSSNNDFTITIDNNSYVTTIKFIDDKDNKTDRIKYSIGVQTENGNNFYKFPKNAEGQDGNNHFKKREHITSVDTRKHNNQGSAYLFEENTPIEDIQKPTYQSVKEPKCLIIDDSDTDSEILPTEKDSLLEVTAEIHKSETEYDCSVLSQLEQEDYEHRTRHAVRGHTPTSTDSSDKENYDPNRVKHPKFDKKHCCKKY